MQIVDISGLTRREWLQLRHPGLGASDSAVIAGQGYKEKTRFLLWVEKTAPEPPPDEEKEFFWWGNEMEPLIAKRFSLDTGMQFAATQVFVRHPSIDWMTCTLDGLTECGEIVDFKTSGYWGGKGIADDDPGTLPPGWHIQAQHQMAVCEKDVAHWAVFSGAELKLKKFVIRRNDELIDLIVQLDSEFMDRVRSGQPPAEFEPADAGHVQRYFKNVNQEEALVLHDPSLLEAATRYCQSKEAIRYAEDERDKRKASLLMAMGDAAVATIGPYRAERKSRTRKGSKGWIEFYCKTTETVENSNESSVE